MALSSGEWYTVKPRKDDVRSKIPLISPERENVAGSNRSPVPYRIIGVVAALLLLAVGAISFGSGKVPGDSGAVGAAYVPVKVPETGSRSIEAEMEKMEKMKTVEPPAVEIHQSVRAAEQAKEPATRGTNRTLRMLATAYTLECGNGDGYTATMTRPRVGIIAVDPRVIPYGYLVYIEGYGYFRAEDTGGAIKGKRIDIYMLTREDALAFGRRWVDVKVVGKIEE